MNTKRICFFDNCKAILIFLVVFGHFVNIIYTPITQRMGIVIYFFHIPLLVFCSGYFASFNSKKILSKNLYPYIIFQTIYLIFMIFVMKENRPLQYTNPYWILWYLFALAIWKMLVPFIESPTLKGRIRNFCILLVLALLAGFDSVTGYYLSLSRIIVFFPFFALAYYIKQQFDFEEFLLFFKQKKIKIISLCVFTLFLALAVIFANPENFDISWLYGALPYKKWNYSIWFRSWFMMSAFAAIPLLCSFVPNKKCFLTHIGQRSLFVYLIHGFFIQLAIKFNYFAILPCKIIMCFLSAVITVFILTRKPVVKMFSPLTDFDSLKELLKRNRT